MDILIENISKEIDGKIVFSDIDWQIKHNSLVAIKGNSGTGKTTLLNIISLLEKPSSGKILFDKTDVTNISIKKRRNYLKEELGFVFQNYGLLENSTIKQNLSLALKFKKLNRKMKHEQMLEVMEQMNLSDVDLQAKVSTLSGGEQQRVGLARCVLKNSNLIIADEPTAALDSTNERIIMTKFKELQAKGHTIVLTTHSENYDEWFDDILHL